MLKAGLVQTSNSRTDDRIGYERQHRTGFYFGAGGAWRFTDRWAAQAEVVTYDKDEFVMSIGIRANW